MCKLYRLSRRIHTHIYIGDMQCVNLQQIQIKSDPPKGNEMHTCVNSGSNRVLDEGIWTTLIIKIIYLISDGNIQKCWIYRRYMYIKFNLDGRLLLQIIN